MRRALALVYLLLLTWLLCTPHPLEPVAPYGPPFWLLRWLYAVHFGSYLLLTAAFAWAFAVGRPGRVPLLAALLASHGIVTEVTQSFIATRTFDPLDLAANLGGVAVGVLFVARWQAMYGPSQSRQA